MEEKLYKNPFGRKIKNSFLLEIYCGHCKEYLVLYQKVGVGNVLRMKVDRIVESTVDLRKRPQDFNCTNCRTTLGHLVRVEDEAFYKMIRGKINTSRAD